MGAWIETSADASHAAAGLSVAPRVGAWIETSFKVYPSILNKSHPVWVRGLKLDVVGQLVVVGASHPVWVRGLKPHLHTVPSHRGASHPVWVRGLKLILCCVSCLVSGSHPVWVRGLKHVRQHWCERVHFVAPRVGAWIETAPWPRKRARSTVAPRVGAWIETLLLLPLECWQLVSHPVWVRGLKLVLLRLILLLLSVAPRVGAWIETNLKSDTSPVKQGRTPCGCVD